MALGDYFKGPEHKANAARLEAELQALQAKYDDLETKAQELGLLDLLEVQKQIRAEEARQASIQAQVATTQSNLAAAQSQLKAVQQQILGAEDTIQLESFALYEPKYQFTNSIDYKKRLDEIREDQKQTTRSLSAQIDAWDNCAVELTKAQWTKLRKDMAKLSLRSFNSEEKAPTPLSP
jgi:chromosome segregation ATPase